MCKNTIYSRLIRVGACVTSDGRSTLRVMVTPESRDILADAKREGHDVTYFTASQTGHRWADIPLAYDPWWERRTLRECV